MRTKRLVAVATVGALLCAPTLWAQTGDTEEVSQQTTSAEQTGQAAGQALNILELDSGPPVTYADVLGNPDNIQLNLRFARAQVNDGNVRGAAATLERILLIDPDLAQVRLFYGVILYRLENLDEAEKELRTVAALDIPADVRAEVDRYLDRIALARRVTRFTASLSLGLHYDTNRDFTPTSETRLFAGVPVAVSNKSDDVGYLGIGSIRVDHDLGYQDKHEFFGSLSYYHDEQDEQDTQDLQSFTARVGGVYGSAYENIDVIPSLSYSQIRLSKETFFQEVGGNLRFEQSFGPTVEGFADFRLATQTFSSIRENTSSNERDGREYSGTIGASWQVAPTHILAGDYQYSDKSAKGRGGAEFFSFGRHQLRLSHTWLMGGGQFLLGSLTVQRDRYNDPDPLVDAGTDRADENYRVRVTYGAPLSHFFGEDMLWDELEDVTFSPSMESLHSNSNLVNFEFTNYKLQAMLSKTWRF